MEAEGTTNQFLIRQQLVLKEIDEALLKSVNSSFHGVRYVAQMYADCVDVGEFGWGSFANDVIVEL